MPQSAMFQALWHYWGYSGGLGMDRLPALWSSLSCRGDGYTQAIAGVSLGRRTKCCYRSLPPFMYLRVDFSLLGLFMLC